MSLSSPFIQRPVATTLLTLALALVGAVGFHFLPVSPLPQIDFPTIAVQASLPGASAEVMASSVATPLERQLGHIAGVTEMTSSSTLGSTSITVQFDLNRDINGAARDVQAAINAARTYLPANLPANPTYRKVNPADAPIMIIAVTSPIHTQGTLYDAASTIIQQRLSQIEGVGQVNVGGSSLPAVRVEVNPTQLNSFGLGLQDVATVLRAQNANLPKGQLTSGDTILDIVANDQLFKAEQYRSLVVAYRNGAPVLLSDVATVEDSIQNTRSAGYMDGKPAVLLIIFRAPGANIIDTVNRIRAALPSLKASIPQSMNLTTVLDRTTTIRASLQDVEWTLVISVCLVILVVFIFLRNARATLIPSVAVPVSLIGTFAVMYLLGYSLDNLSLMALTISTGFVVDDAIVVIENISRHLEQGLTPREAALKGASEIGFTVLSISISLVAVFIPILFMGGIVGRLFREFAITLSVAIVVSLMISLTLTPMMCSRLLTKEHPLESHGRLYQASERVFVGVLAFYEKSLSAVLRHPTLALCVLLLTVAANVLLLVKIPKGFFPQQDNGTVFGGIQATQGISFQSMNRITHSLVNVIKQDPAIEHVMAFTGGQGASNTAFIYLGLKPLKDRKINASQVIARLRPKLLSVPDATAFLQAGQDVRIGGRQSNAQYQYTIQSEQVQDLVDWGPKLLQGMRSLPGFADINSDQQNQGLQTTLLYDRLTSSRVGITPELLDTSLSNAFGQSLVSTIYTSLNQYYVVMEVANTFRQSPQSLNNFYIRSNNSTIVPIQAVTQTATTTGPLAVNHQGLFPSVTISFNLAPGVALSDASRAIDELQSKLGMPSTIHGMFSGTLQAFQASLASEPFLILTALLAVYIVLGILYESYIHPITILSTLPSAGVGGVLILMLFRLDFSIVALIGMVLLIGIVKKNAILMIDFALVAEREEGRTPRDAIFQASLLRFRPILMTTLAALFGALPLAFGSGMGSELRQPLGITIIGGLIFSQVQTLYTTPVVYLFLDRMRMRWKARRGGTLAGPTALLLGIFIFNGCASVGPDYKKPPVEIPKAFRSQTPEATPPAVIWKPAQPQEAASRGKWWESFKDLELNALEEQVDTSNQNIAVAYASYQQAVAFIQQARSAYYPTVSTSPNVTVQRGQGVSSGYSASSGGSTFTGYNVPLTASWVPDLWGRVRRTVEQNQATAQMRAADLENIRLTQHAQLAIAYFELRMQDELIALFRSTVQAYEESLRLTRSRAQTGIDSDEAVAQAETQLKTAQAQAAGLGIARAQYEHAIALFTGKPASSFSLPAKSLMTLPPRIPTTLPSELLERRPDIAAAERSMAAANAAIGVATSAYYPQLTLSGQGGFGSNSIRGLLALPTFVWSIGATLAETIFDGGYRSAVVKQSEAVYTQTVATYRQTVLTAFQQVEDSLAGTSLLAQQLAKQEDAIRSSQRYLKIATRRFELGLDPYLNVLSAQITLLSNQQTAVNLRGQLFSSNVQLIEALGGNF